MEHSEQLSELAKALVEVQRTLKPAVKDSTNPHFKSKYADLESVMDALREPLATNGLAILQTTEPDPAGVVLVTTLLHVSGQFMRGRLRMVPQRNDPQGIGSCITYARRYGAAAIVGLSQTDDDGESASGRGEGGRPSAPALSPPRRVPAAADVVVAPGKPLVLTGDTPTDRPLNKAERDGILRALDVERITTDALREYMITEFNLETMAKLRTGHLDRIRTWIKAQANKSEVA